MKRSLHAALPFLVVACAGDRPVEEDAPAAAQAAAPLDGAAILWSVDGLAGPEAVRWDPDQRVWFIANFGPGSGEERDGDGFISRVGADGQLESLRFMVGTADAPLHMARGMFIRDDTLWVADVDGVHGFDPQGGDHLAFVDFSAHAPGFLNDIAAAPDGPLYVTDTGRGRVYRMSGAGATPDILVDSLPELPNGITWSPDRNAFLLAPWEGGQVVRSLTPDGVVDSVASVPSGRMDGIEVLGGRMLIAAQADSSLWLVEEGGPRRVVRTPGAPADIAYDPQRGLVAVPFVRLNRVDVWRVP